jgi:RND family efflux transporter MFP subunit
MPAVQNNPPDRPRANKTIAALLLAVTLVSSPSVAKIDGAKIDVAKIDGAKIDGAKIDGAKIDGAKIDGAQVDGAQIDGAPGRGAEEIHAQIVPLNFTTLSSDTAGQIERMTVREGDRFVAGQVLVSMDCALQRAELDEARAVLAGAQKASSVNRRMVELHSGGQLEAEMAAVDVLKNQAKVRSAEVIVSKCTISAPYQGRVVEQKVHEHQYVQAGQPMLEILDDSALQVEFIVPSNWLAWIRPGMAFQLFVDESGKTYPAKVISIGAKVDAVSHSIKITGELTTKADDLIAGMSGLVRLPRPM